MLLPLKVCVKMVVFLDVASCSLLDIDRRFREAYCLHHQGDHFTRRRENLRSH
jgi:hypothetical protein